MKEPLNGLGRVHGESVLAPGGPAWAEEGLAQVNLARPRPGVRCDDGRGVQPAAGQLDDDLRAVTVAKMEDYTNQEIAQKLDCSAATIERRLRLVRSVWKTLVHEVNRLTGRGLGVRLSGMINQSRWNWVALTSDGPLP